MNGEFSDPAAAANVTPTTGPPKTTEPTSTTATIAHTNRPTDEPSSLSNEASSTRPTEEESSPRGHAASVETLNTPGLCTQCDEQPRATGFLAIPRC